MKVLFNYNGSLLKMVLCFLFISNFAFAQNPFGSFDSPTEGSNVYGTVTLSGWALDESGGLSAELFRKDGEDLIFIDNIPFEEGARPDVSAAYPGYYGGGWKYDLITHYLPEFGNGTFQLVVKLTDADENTFDFPPVTINCDNTTAVNPFGTIETPQIGGIASGENYNVSGWVLTPPPSAIATDGSTIDIYVDGIKVGNPVYNTYRSELAQTFTGYNNAEGAGGHFELNTTLYQDGVHSIQWIVTDDNNNSSTIGARYFQIKNGPEIHITGNDNYIASGDTIPAVTDHTDYGEMIIGSMPVIHTFTIHNLGAGELELFNLPAVNIDGAGFNLNTEPFSPVAGNETVTFDIEFYPADEGVKTALVTIENSDSDENPYTFTIKGTGIPDVTGVSDTEVSIDFELQNNYPNPFNPETTIKYSVPEKSFVAISVFDIIGNRVAKLVKEEKLPGKYSVKFNGKGMASGIYYYKMTAGNYTKTKKAVLVK